MIGTAIIVEIEYEISLGIFKILSNNTTEDTWIIKLGILLITNLTNCLLLSLLLKFSNEFRI